MSIKYYVIDTETTGLKSNFHEMCEIGIVRCSDRVQLYRKIKCYNPERASLDALQIMQKNIKDLTSGNSRYEVVDEVERFFSEDGLTPGHRCIVGHNIVSFDRKFLHSLWDSVGKKFPANLWLDTIHLTQELIRSNKVPESKMVKTATGKISRTLHAACDMVGIKKISEAHNAKVDSRNNYLLWRSLTEDHKINYIPHIKTMVHSSSEGEERADIY